MHPKEDESKIQENIKRLLKNPPVYKLSDTKRREFIARLYKVSEERRSIITRIQSMGIPVFARVLATAVFLFFVYIYLFALPNPAVYNTKGTVKIYRSAKNEWIFVKKPGIKLYKNDILKTFEGGQADIIVPNLYHIRLKDNSEIKLAYSTSRVLPGGIEYDLSKGKVFAYYKKTEGGNRQFNIETPQAIASALGTDFMVQALPDAGRTWVGVLNGVVAVIGTEGPAITKAGENMVFVNAGEKTVVRQGAVPAKPTRLIENELLELEELYRIGTKPQVALLISTGKSRTRELLSVTPLYISAEKPGILPEKIEKIARKFSQAVKEGSKEKHLENIRQFEEIVNQYPDPKYDVQFLLFIAAYYEYLDEHDKAIVTFQRIINDYPRSNLTSIAQCAIGIIYEEKLNDIKKAEDAYNKVIVNYPRSVEVEEAISGLNRLAREVHSSNQ